MNVVSDLAHYRYLNEWKPEIGDTVIYHGWLYSHWYGIISGINPADHTLAVIHKGLPVLMLTLDPGEYEKNTTIIPISDIRKSTGGKYAVQRATGGNIVWFI
tara:strand:- start:66541 stop:66846 length:306 start_codon:yes stop_codon:yes gene_type:complete